MMHLRSPRQNRRQLQLRVERALGPCSHLNSSETSFVYCVGAGVASNNLQGDSFQFRVCAPKQISEDKQSTQQLGQPGSQSGAKVKINPINCTAVSCSGQIAIGETGHMPRIAIFAPNSAKVGATMQEHQFGVHLMAFSPSGNFLATLGTPNDGSIYIWNTRPRTKVCLEASNRCISEVRALVWLSDSVLVTAGVRHVRVWTLSESLVLQGRNILLEDYGGSKFTCVLPLNQTEFFVADDRGQMFKVAGNKLQLLLSIDTAVCSITTHKDGYAIAGSQTIYFYDANLILTSKLVRECQAIVNTESLLYLKDQKIFALESEELLTGAKYIGVVVDRQHIWAWSGTQITMFDAGLEVVSETAKNGVQDIRPVPEGLAIAFDNGKIEIEGTEFQAFEQEGNTIRIDVLDNWVICAGRDVYIQVFKREGTDWIHFQSIPMTGRATQARFANQSTIVIAVNNKIVHILCADETDGGYFKPSKTIAQSSPIQGMLVHNEQIMLCTLDKKINWYRLDGSVAENWTATDLLGEPVCLCNPSIMKHEKMEYILGSLSDKSIALYHDGELVACQWAHAEQPSTVVSINQSTILSAGSDGLFMYKLHEAQEEAATPDRVDRSRSVSPVRIVRSPSPTRKLRSTRSSTSLQPHMSPAKPLRSPTRPAQPVLQPALQPSPSLRMAEPAPAAAPQDLNKQLQEFIDRGTGNDKLFVLLTKALDKCDRKKAAAFYSQKVANYLNQA